MMKIKKLTKAMRAQADSQTEHIANLRAYYKPGTNRCHAYRVWCEKQIEADARERYQLALVRLADATDLDACPDELDGLVFEHDILPKLRTLKNRTPSTQHFDSKVWADQSETAKSLRKWLGIAEHQPNADPSCLQ